MEWMEAACLSAVERKQLDPVAILAMDASQEAMEMAGIPANAPNGGVFFGTGAGGITSLMRNHINHLPGARSAFLKEPSARFNPFVVSMVMLNSTSGTLSRKFKIHGPSRSYASSCASATVAIGNAYLALKNGEAQWCITGGTEYLMDETGCMYHGFDVAATLTRIPEAAKCNRPFDRERNGFLFGGGGAGTLVLETQEHAEARGANVLAWLDGFSENCDGHSPMAPHPEGRCIRQCVRAALDDAGLTSDDIDVINAHGTGTTANDAVEAELIRDLFPSRPVVGTTKALSGHLLGASGAVETIASVVALLESAVHAMPNLDDPEIDLNFAKGQVKGGFRHVAKFSFGFGGHNAVLILSNKDDSP